MSSPLQQLMVNTGLRRWVTNGPQDAPDRPRLRDRQGPPGLLRLLRRVECWSHLSDPRRSRQSALVLVADRQRSDDALDRVATLEEAKAQFQKSWDAWKAWASWRRCRANREIVDYVSTSFVPRPVPRGAFLYCRIKPEACFKSMDRHRRLGLLWARGALLGGLAADHLAGHEQRIAVRPGTLETLPYPIGALSFGSSPAG